MLYVLPLVLFLLLLCLLLAAACAAVEHAATIVGGNIENMTPRMLGTREDVTYHF